MKKSTFAISSANEFIVITVPIVSPSTISVKFEISYF